MKTNIHLSKIGVPKIRYFNNESKKYNDVLRLTIGEPHFPPPEKIKEYAIKAINNNDYNYVLGLGRDDVKKKLLRYVKKHFNQEYTEDEILLTVGTTEGIYSSLGAILNAGDEVIIPAPAYMGYEPLVILNNSKAVYMDTSYDNFQIRYDNLKKYLTNKTKCLILNYPNNPTGVCLDKKSIEAIKKVMKEFDIFIIIDEIYNRIIYDEYSTITEKEFKDRVIIINGLSKSHSLTGWRLGFVLTNKHLIDKILKIHQHTVVAVNTITQYAATQVECDISDRIKYYKDNVEYAYSKLKEMGLEVVKPNGTYYIFPKVPISSKKMFYDLLEQERVAIIPGICFGDYPDYIRISCSVDYDILVEALRRIANYLERIME